MESLLKDTPVLQTPPRESYFFLCVADVVDDTKTLAMLEALELKFVGQVLAQSENRFLELAGYGRKTLKKLKTALKSLGLEFGEAPLEWSDISSAEFEDLYKKEIKGARRQFAKRKTKTLSLEGDLASLLAVEHDTRNRRLIAMRYGWSGSPPAKLQDVGNKFGPMTRERVRQICDRFQKSVRRKAWHLPSINKSIKIIADSAPATEEALAQALVEEGLASEPPSIAGVISAAIMTGINVRIENADAPFSNFWVPDGAAFLPAKILSLARRHLSAEGVATLDQIADEVQDRYSSRVEPEAVASVLSGQSSYTILDESQGWFWFETRRNRLINVLRKIFSVTDRVHVSEVRAAVQRFQRLKGFAPPQRVLIALADTIPEFETDGSFLIRRPGVDPQSWIEGTEETLAAVLNESGGIMDRVSLEKKCLRRGMNETTFVIYLSISPIIQNLGRGAFALIGTQYDSATISQHRLAPSKKAVINYCWTANGHILICYRITENTLYTGFFPLPSQMSDYLAGEFTLFNSDNKQIGRVKTKGQNAWSLKKLFRAMGGEVGDLFEITFELDAKRAVMSFGEHQD